MTLQNNGLKATIIKDSISDDGVRLITIHWRYPRIIHSEIMTHRVFSRNARSSRAVPVSRMLEEVRTNPFVPWHWGKNQKGMQANEECNELVFLETDRKQHWTTREDAWRKAAYEASRIASAYAISGYHKQIANRLLEPFMYIDTLLTSTKWANFFHLRNHKDAEPHFHDLAELTFETFQNSTPTHLKFGEWHLPYVSDEELETHGLEVCQKLSVARSARISYEPFDGDASIERELERYKLLVGGDPLHASPAEHQATPDRMIDDHWIKPKLHGNLTGWKQYRKFLDNEFVDDSFNLKG